LLVRHASPSMDTHRFYEVLGYTLAATSHLFTRAL
jgi:hypothetical protein